MKVDESMVSGVDKIKDFFGSTLDNNDTANMLGALGDPKPAGAGAPTVLDINSAEASVGGAQAPKSTDTPSGRIKGWKERLDLMRRQKA